MSKIVQAVNAIISNPKLIGSVLKGDIVDEFYFTYKKKYKWSIRKDGNSHILYYYPGNMDIETLVNEVVWVGIEMIAYIPDQIGTKEAKSSFADLYTLLSEKFSGMDDILDDIISDVDF